VFTSFERGIAEFEGHGAHLLRWLYVRLPALRRPLRALLGSRLVLYSQRPELLKVVHINPLLRVGVLCAAVFCCLCYFSPSVTISWCTGVLYVVECWL
jgi:hypothetical protein